MAKSHLKSTGSLKSNTPTWKKPATPTAKTGSLSYYGSDTKSAPNVKGQLNNRAVKNANGKSGKGAV